MSSLTATAQALAVAEVVTPIGSGIDNNWPKLARLLYDQPVSAIAVELWGRLARFGKYLTTIGCGVVVKRKAAMAAAGAAA